MDAGQGFGRAGQQQIYAVCAAHKRCSSTHDTHSSCCSSTSPQHNCATNQPTASTSQPANQPTQPLNQPYSQAWRCRSLAAAAAVMAGLAGCQTSQPLEGRWDDPLGSWGSLHMLHARLSTVYCAPPSSEAGGSCCLLDCCCLLWLRVPQTPGWRG